MCLLQRMAIQRFLSACGTEIPPGSDPWITHCDSHMAGGAQHRTGCSSLRGPPVPQKGVKLLYTRMSAVQMFSHCSAPNVTTDLALKKFFEKMRSSSVPALACIRKVPFQLHYLLHCKSGTSKQAHQAASQPPLHEKYLIGHMDGPTGPPGRVPCGV